MPGAGCPRPAPLPEGSEASLTALQRTAEDLAGRLDDLAAAVGLSSYLGDLWGARLLVALPLLDLSEALFAASRRIEAHLAGAGASLDGGVWRVPGEDEGLQRLAETWDAILEFEVETLAPLLLARDPAAVNAAVGSAGWCGPAASLVGALASLSGGGEG